MTCVIVIIPEISYIKTTFKGRVMKEKEIVLKVIEEIGLPVKTGDIVKRTGLDRNKVQKILNELSLEGKLVLDRCYNKVLKKGGNNG